MSVAKGLEYVPFQQAARALGTYGGVPVMAASIYATTKQFFPKYWSPYFTSAPIAIADPEGILGTFGVPPVMSGGIHLLAEHNFSIIEVSPRVAAPGETVAVTMTGWLGIPAGVVSVYLFPFHEPGAKEGYERAYYKAERDHRITAERSYLNAPTFSYTMTIVAGEEEAKCDGGDMCDMRYLSDEPPDGDYRVAVGFPSPYYTNRTILVMGPAIRIQTSKAQEDAKEFEDEAEFLFEQLCDKVEEQQTPSWPFLREVDSCGGFSSSRPSLGTPVWNSARMEADTRPPLFIENDTLCMKSSAGRGYEGKAKACIPYTGDPTARLPSKKQVSVDIVWSGSLYALDRNDADMAIRKMIQKNKETLLPNVEINPGEIKANSNWRNIGENTLNNFYTEDYNRKENANILVVINEKRHICFFVNKKIKDEDLTDPNIWRSCSMVLKDPAQ
jgi:hypothetical protein